MKQLTFTAAALLLAACQTTTQPQAGGPSASYEPELMPCDMVPAALSKAQRAYETQQSLRSVPLVGIAATAAPDNYDTVDRLKRRARKCGF